MKNSKSGDQYTKIETERHFTAALGRALTTPHKPHKPIKKAAKKKGRTKARPKSGE